MIDFMWLVLWCWLFFTQFLFIAFLVLAGYVFYLLFDSYKRRLNQK